MYFQIALDITHNMISDQGIHFTRSSPENLLEITYTKILWSYHIPHHPQGADLIESCYGLLKTLLQCYQLGNILHKKKVVFQTTYSTSSSNGCYCSSHGQNTMNSGIKVCKVGMAPLIVSSDDAAIRFFLFSDIRMLFWPRSFSSKEGSACARKPSKHSIELQAKAFL